MTQQEFIERYHYDATRDLLGKGGFGRVYRAYDREEHEYVAIKMQSVDPDHPELRLRNEFEKVQQYRHRYIARYKECYTFSSIDGEKDVAVMKYYKDGSLDALIKSNKLDLEARFAMLRHILEGIAFLHSHGIIHRDLKPQNILIAEYDGTYEPLITDFGISKQLEDGESSAVSNSVLGGTYSYASPEQLKETTIRKNTDLWSFGVIAYQMLTGAFPFNCGEFSPTSQEGRQEQFRQMTSGVLPKALNNVPEPWQRLIRQCLVVDNTQRLAHIEDCMAILNNQPEDVPVDESTIVEPPVEVNVVDEPVKEEVKPHIDTPQQKEQPKPSAPKKRSKWWLWLLFLLLVAIGGAVGYMLSGNDNGYNADENLREVERQDSLRRVEELEQRRLDSLKRVEREQFVRDSIREQRRIDSLKRISTFTLAKSSLTVGSSGGSYSVGYTIEYPINTEHPIDGESVSVSVSDNQSWITNLSASGGKITFKTTNNTSTEPRSGTITATYDGITRQITVTQEKGVRTYAIGDYYNENGKKGVVFQVWDGGRHGKIVSLDQTEAAWDSRVKWDSANGYSGGTRTYADSESDGKANTDNIMARTDSEYFDAFEWCRAKGSSWYLPAKNELKQISNNIGKLNSTLRQYGTVIGSEYWSSTEDVYSIPEFCAWRVGMDDGYTDGDDKSYGNYVRAVSAF